MSLGRLTDTGKLDDNLRVYCALGRFAEMALARSRLDEAALWTEVAAWYASRYNPGFFQLTDGERRLLAIKDAVVDPSAFSGRTRSAGVASGDPQRVLHVITEGIDIGGHTRVLCRWIEGDHRTGAVVFTKNLNIPENVQKSAALVDAPVYGLKGSPTARAGQLRELAAGYDFVVLDILTFDAVPILAFGGEEESPPVLFFNQGDYVSWLGICATNVLVNARNVGAQFSEHFRHVPPEHLAVLPMPPTPVEGLENFRASRRTIREKFAIAADDVVLLTVATGYKHRPFLGLSLPAVLQPVLATHPNVRFIAIGMDPPFFTPAWESLRAEFGDRVMPLPSVPVPEATYWMSDIYLDPIPCGSTLSAIDASLRELPVVSLNINGALGILEPGEPGWGVTGIEAPGFGENHFLTQSLDEYYALLYRMIDDAEYRVEVGRRGRQDLLDVHSGESWTENLERIYAQASNVGKIPLRPEAEFRNGDLEVMLAELCDHNRWGPRLVQMIEMEMVRD